MRRDPIYDVLHTNNNEQWSAAEMGLIEPEIAADQVPNMADLYDYAKSDKVAGVVMFTSAIGLGYRRISSPRRPPRGPACGWMNTPASAGPT